MTVRERLRWPWFCWRCVDTDRWEGRLIAIERNRLTGAYRRREMDRRSVHEVVGDA